MLDQVRDGAEIVQIAGRRSNRMERAVRKHGPARDADKAAQHSDDHCFGKEEAGDARGRHAQGSKNADFPPATDNGKRHGVIDEKEAHE